MDTRRRSKHHTSPRRNKLLRLNLMKEDIKQLKRVNRCDKNLVHPDSKFKAIWDLIVIIFSVYNSVLIPYEFAYDHNSHIILDICDRIIDTAFIVDIFINFRTMYRNSHTDELVKDGKKIAINYILYGRFGVDLVASMPLEVVVLIIPSSTVDLRFLGMLKLVRLLRLGRLITLLRANQKLKFSLKFGQLIFFILMIMHWINCLWYFVTESNKTWFPPKDLDYRVTSAYTTDSLSAYNMFYYYACIILVGSEILPTDNTELLVSTLLLFLGTIFIGMIIGEFASLLSALTKKDREKSEEVDIISTIMLNLRLPEKIQDRIFDYYYGMNESQYVPNSITETIKYYQTRPGIRKLLFLDSRKSHQLDAFCKDLELCYFLSGDIILKQGLDNEYVYFIIEGFVEVILEHNDFEYFDFKKVQQYIAHKKKQCLDDDSDHSFEEPVVEEKITNVFMEALRIAKEKAAQEANNQCPDGSDAVVVTEIQKTENNLKILNQSEEDSIGCLVPNKSKTERNFINSNDAKIVPSSLVTKMEMQDSKSTVKSSGHESSSNLVDEPTFPHNMSPTKNTKVANEVHFENPIKSIINKYGRIDDSKNYTVLNELEAGTYFGEISALNNLPITASVHTAGDTICARMHKSNFIRFLENHGDSNSKIKEQMFKYQDPLFRTLHKMIVKVPILKTLKHSCVRRILLRLTRIQAKEEKALINLKEICDKIYFIYSGEVLISTIDPETGARIPFVVLREGSCFNFFTCILSNYSLFEFSACTDCVLLQLTREDFYDLSKTSPEIKEIIDQIHSSYIVVGMKYDFYQTVEEPKSASRPDSSSRNLDSSFISASPISSSRGDAFKKRKRVNFKSMAQGNFLIPNPKGYYLPQKILNKIHAFRGELISRLKKAAKTFAIIDATYQEIIKVEALKCNNQHIFSQFQSRIREMQEALGSMNGKTPYQSLFNDKEVRESMSTFGNQHKDIYSYEAEEILHSSDSEEEIKEQNRKMSKYLNKNIEKVINWLQPNKSLGQRRFTNPPLAKSISETQLRGNNLKIAIKRNMGIASDADLTSGNATPKGEKTDTSTISKYERMLYTTTERYTNALDTARIQSFNECLTKARKSFMDLAKNTKEYNKLVNSDIRRIREDINDLTKARNLPNICSIVNLKPKMS
ncbi:unnamed protein product [Moneuplotes crassus]|uniref:Cyclic nucleotide-binding domain-containing protein n=1 Tax=Euplotes crassus TaxID=5936 RepID=A0AAD1UBD6_EUPCR|nr:unnamed protein product [Moneuplotes crassus]